MEILNTKSTQWTTPLILCVAVFFSSSVFAQNNIGHIIYSTGEIQATNGGETRTLKRGSAISEGDTITSGRSTRSQLRMSDGALIALRPNTKFSFDKYRYEKNDDTNNSSIFNLIKGGFRTISGLIGKRSKKNYRVKTTIATIGIRGTHYGLTLCQDNDCSEDQSHAVKDGLYGSVIDGEITAENETGEFVFSNDEFFHVASNKSKPRSLLKPPGVVFGQNKLGKKLKKMAASKKSGATTMDRRHAQNAGMVNAVALLKKKRNFILNHVRPGFEATNDTTISPSSFIAPSDVGNVLAFSFFEIESGTSTPFLVLDKVRSDGTEANQFFLNSVAKENGLFIPVAAQQTTGPMLSPTVRTLFIGNAMPVDVGSVIVPGTTLAVGWGRWTNQYVAKDNGSVVPHVGNLHYVVATDTTSLAQLGGLTGTASYSTVAGTRATDLAANVAANVADVTMGVNFTARTIANFNVATNVAGKVYQASLPMPVLITSAITGGLNLSGNIPCPACVGQASLAFLGPNAEGAATVYGIRNNISGNAINGTAILSQ